jgi:hypothetical protein
VGKLLRYDVKRLWGKRMPDDLDGRFSLPIVRENTMKNTVNNPGHGKPNRGSGHVRMRTDVVKPNAKPKGEAGHVKMGVNPVKGRTTRPKGKTGHARMGTDAVKRGAHIERKLISIHAQYLAQDEEDGGKAWKGLGLEPFFS